MHCQGSLPNAWPLFRMLIFIPSPISYVPSFPASAALDLKLPGNMERKKNIPLPYCYMSLREYFQWIFQVKSQIDISFKEIAKAGK